MNAVQLASTGLPRNAFIRLPRWETTIGVADDCRHAALAFMRGTQTGWARSDLVAWLLGPYWKATRHISEDVWAELDELTAKADEARVTAVLVRTREEIFERLQRAADDFSYATFASAIVDTNLVANVVDESGSSGFVPCRLLGLTLVERVTSLFAADFLARSDDYVGLWTCDDCGGVGIGTAGEHTPGCEGVRIQSAIRPCPPSSIRVVP